MLDTLGTYSLRYSPSTRVANYSDIIAPRGTVIILVTAKISGL